jgi:hypothetical protein
MRRTYTPGWRKYYKEITFTFMCTYAAGSCRQWRSTKHTARQAMPSRPSLSKAQVSNRSKRVSFPQNPKQLPVEVCPQDLNRWTYSLLWLRLQPWRTYAVVPDTLPRAKDILVGKAFICAQTIKQQTYVHLIYRVPEAKHHRDTSLTSRI